MHLFSDISATAFLDMSNYYIYYESKFFSASTFQKVCQFVLEKKFYLLTSTIVFTWMSVETMISTYFSRITDAMSLKPTITLNSMVQVFD